MHIAFRVDASSAIGSGHLMRCLTLADALLNRQASSRFVCRELAEPWQALVRSRGHELMCLGGGASDANEPDPLAHAHWLSVSQSQDAAESAAALRDRQWDWLVVDHYALDERWETPLRALARRIIVIDDLADRRHDSDLLLDQNLYADMQSRYAGKVPDSCRQLLGPHYSLLREEFRAARQRVGRQTVAVKRVLISFGGVDAANHTAAAIDAMARLNARDLQVDVVIGARHGRRSQIEAACVAHSFACHVQTDRMAELMVSADLAIGAGGGAGWERCCLGLPTLVLCAAENQRKQIADAAVAGLWYAPDVSGGEHVAAVIERHARTLLENPLLRSAISRRGMDAVDGRGALRVVGHMDDASVEIRRAGPDDCRSVFEWRNHPSIRSVSQNSGELDWSRHQQWYAAVLADPDRVLLIGHRGGAAVGVVRFDVRNDEAEVSIYLVPGVAEPGSGGALLRAAERWIGAHRPSLRTLCAQVLAGNEASHKLFTACGYQAQSVEYSKRMRPQ